MLIGKCTVAMYVYCIMYNISSSLNSAYHTQMIFASLLVTLVMM